MNEYDVAVIGGGAAGLSAALVLSRARRSVAVIDAGEPRNAPATHMQGFLSRDGMPPAELLAAGRAEVTSYGGRLVEDRVTAVRAGFELDLADGTLIRARRVLVTTGLRDELPDIPGLQDRWARDVLHCPYCHGYEVRDQAIVVLGGTPDAAQHALLLRQWSGDVVFLPHTSAVTIDERAQLTARGVEIVEGTLRGLLVEDDRLRGVELVDGRIVPCAAAFVRPTFVPNDDLLTMLDSGWVVTDTTGRTSVDGVWVAGNVANPRAQVITAAGEGSTAAIAINAHLVAEEVRPS